MVSTVTVKLPPSSIGKYHKKENRLKFKAAFDKILEDDEVMDAGVPAAISWIDEFEYHHTGADLDFSITDPFGKYVHGGCAPCPLGMLSQKPLVNENPGGSIVFSLIIEPVLDKEKSRIFRLI